MARQGGAIDLEKYGFTKGEIKFSAKDGRIDRDKGGVEAYNKRRWVVKNYIVDETEYADFLYYLDETYNRAPYKKTKESYYIVPSGRYDGVDNILFVTNANQDDLQIYRVYRIFEYTETDIEKVRDVIAANEKKHGGKAVRIVQRMFEEGLVFGEHVSDYAIHWSESRAGIY